MIQESYNYFEQVRNEMLPLLIVISVISSFVCGYVYCKAVYKIKDKK